MSALNRKTSATERLITGGVFAGLALLVVLIVRVRPAAEGSQASASPSPAPPSVRGSSLTPDSRTAAVAEATRPGMPRGDAPRSADPGSKMRPPEGLLFPVPAVSPASISDNFNDRRGSRTHHALDIMAPRHSQVVAVADGAIARMMLSDAGGITLYQWSEDRRLVFYYAHLQGYAFGLAEGQPIGRGQVLGYVGSTGNAPPGAPHLHFGIVEADKEGRWWGGLALNPYQAWR